MAGTVFDFLDQVAERPGMFVGDGPDPLGILETMLHGYNVALSSHSIVESAPTMNRAFASWLRLRYPKWSLSCGWAGAITDNSSPGESPLARFFALVADYRKLVPRTLLSATLKPQHQPTGRRVVIGLRGRMDRPDRVEVARYEPAPLHVLRLFYETEVEISVVHGPNAAHASTLDDAKQWLAEELQLSDADFDPA